MQPFYLSASVQVQAPINWLSNSFPCDWGTREGALEKIFRFDPAFIPNKLSFSDMVYALVTIDRNGLHCAVFSRNDLPHKPLVYVICQANFGQGSAPHKRQWISRNGIQFPWSYPRMAQPRQQWTMLFKPYGSTKTLQPHFSPSPPPKKKALK